MRTTRRTIQKIAQAINHRVGRLVPSPVRARVREALFPPDSRPSMELLIDVAAACNLRCPSCPVGNIGKINPTGLIDKDLFRKIIEKADREYNVFQVSLFNWGEPSLHPELPELVSIVRSHGLNCSISSNLNMVRRLDDLFRAEPTLFRISLSGFTQNIYGQSHVRGNIERVKENMRLVAESRRRVGTKTTDVQVYFHKYRHNLGELAQMKEYATSLGFSWLENWAYYMPIEKTLALAEGQLPEGERAYVEDTFALPIGEALAAALPYRDHKCRLYEQQIVLDLQGQIILCCGVYDYKSSGGLGSFLEMTPKELMKAKENHPTCEKCTRNAIHVYAEYSAFPELSEKYAQLVESNLKKQSLRASRIPAHRVMV
jgi:hypothetical protein